MKKKVISRLLAASALVFAASASQAAVVTEWDFVLNMQWNVAETVFAKSQYKPGTYDISGWYNGGWYNGSRTANLDGGRTSKGPSEISWGASGGWYLSKDPLYARSGLVIDPSQKKGTISTSFEGGGVNVTTANMFSHFNGEIPGTSDYLSHTQLDVQIQLMVPGYSDKVVNITKSFEVHFFETPNLGKTGCVYSTNCDDDVFAVVSAIGLDHTFWYDGIEYTLNYFESTDHVQKMSDEACKFMKFGTGICYGFTTPESARTDVKFNFSITAVPEPETYAMMLAGLGMIGFVARRRKIRN
jgi:hypothetical protein